MNREELREHVRRTVADWPPLTPEQLAQLAALLRPVQHPAAVRRAA